MKRYQTITQFFIGIVLLSACAKDKTPLALVDPSCVDTISFSNQIEPLFQDYCISCHNTGNPTGFVFNDHDKISQNADAILNSMYGTAGVELMPQGGPALEDSLIKQFQCWINQGKLNN